MKDVIGIFWPWTTPFSEAAVPPEFQALIDEIARIAGIRITPAAPGQVPDARQPCLVVHLAFIEGAILAYEAAVARGHEDSAQSFSAFASAGFSDFLAFRRQWIAPDEAAALPRLNVSRLRADAEAEIGAFLDKLTPGTSADAATVAAIAAAAGPVLDRVAPARFRHHDHKMFAALRQIKLPRESVAETFQEVMQRAPDEDQILFFQAMPSVDRLTDKLMSSQEYLTRFALSDEEIQTCYRALLGRAPAPEEQERARTRHPTLDKLRKAVLKSAEFSRQYARFGGAAGKSFMAGMAGSTDQPVRPASMPALKPPTQDRVVFLHIPKCGGTTLHNMLRSWFGPENVHPERFNGLYGYTGASLASSIVFSGHYDHYSTTLIPGPQKRISFLRDPLDRLVSLYNFHRAHAPAIIERNNLQLPRWANEHDIDAYFAHPTIRAHPAIDNAIVRYFSDIPQVAQSARTAAEQGVTMDDMLEQALRNLAQFAFVGFMDRYEADMDRLAVTLDRDPPGKLKKHQVLDDLMQSNPDMRKIRKQTPGADCVAAMEPLVAYDRVFYARARELFS